VLLRHTLYFEPLDSIYMKSLIYNLLKKIGHRLKHPSVFLYSQLTNTTFPVKPVSKFRINARLSAALSDIKNYNIHHNIGALISQTNKYAVQAYSTFLKNNPNNLGNWSTSPNESGTKRLEYELIHKLINLYHAQNKNIEGYITSGGTEGNLYMVWLGKSHISRYVKLDQMCLFRTNLTHYSIDKACRMYSIGQTIISLNKNTWTMDSSSLARSMNDKYKTGIRGFIISLTLGYTETGSSVNIRDILIAVEIVRKQHKNIHISIIIDAAFDGLVLPFITEDFQPFIDRNIHAISIDFSKFMAVPYPAGAVLYQKQLRKLIEKKVPVFTMKDNTITGSRPGAPVAAIWAVIHQSGKQKFKEIITKQIKLKQMFIIKMKELFPNSEIISNPLSLTCGVILHKNKYLFFPKKIEERYWLYAKKTKLSFSHGTNRTVILYKFFFLQHVTKRVIENFFHEIQGKEYGKQ
jgi:glutamate/tyrosine decarboxylase-like PLP-dependent enzyme